MILPVKIDTTAHRNCYLAANAVSCSEKWYLGAQGARGRSKPIRSTQASSLYEFKFHTYR